jgi:hypothetical protein
MQACSRILSASYGPDALKTMTQAFDQAWSVIAGNIRQDGRAAARLRLASALLSVATEDSHDVQDLKRNALEAMSLSYYAVRSDTSNLHATGREKTGQQLA